MQDWHSEADDALAELKEFYNNPCYQAMVQWFQCLYEREKERVAMAHDPEQVQFHWLMAKGMKELLAMVQITPE